MAMRITVGEVLGEKPHVHLVGPYYVANDQIVSPVIAVVARLLRRSARLEEDLFMCVEQSRDLRRQRFSPLGRTCDRAHLRYVMRRREWDTAERGDAFGQSVHQPDLLGIVFVKQEMQRIEGSPSNLPMVFLVQIAQRHCVGEQLVERISA